MKKLLFFAGLLPLSNSVIASHGLRDTVFNDRNGGSASYSSGGNSFSNSSSIRDSVFRESISHDKDASGRVTTGNSNIAKLATTSSSTSASREAQIVIYAKMAKEANITEPSLLDYFHQHDKSLASKTEKVHEDSIDTMYEKILIEQGVTGTVLTQKMQSIKEERANYVTALERELKEKNASEARAHAQAAKNAANRAEINRIHVQNKGRVTKN